MTTGAGCVSNAQHAAVVPAALDYPLDIEDPCPAIPGRPSPGPPRQGAVWRLAMAP